MVAEPSNTAAKMQEAGNHELLTSKVPPREDLVVAEITESRFPSTVSSYMAANGDVNRDDVTTTADVLPSKSNVSSVDPDTPSRKKRQLPYSDSPEVVKTSKTMDDGDASSTRSKSKLQNLSYEINETCHSIAPR